MSSLESCAIDNDLDRLVLSSDPQGCFSHMRQLSMLNMTPLSLEMVQQKSEVYGRVYHWCLVRVRDRELASRWNLLELL